MEKLNCMPQLTAFFNKAVKLRTSAGLFYIPFHVNQRIAVPKAIGTSSASGAKVEKADNRIPPRQAFMLDDKKMYFYNSINY
jgi:hypothetical protein